jgi:hypothetical protein
MGKSYEQFIDWPPAFKYGAIILWPLWPVALEFPADGSVVSVDPLSNLAQAEPGTL